MFATWQSTSAEMIDDPGVDHVNPNSAGFDTVFVMKSPIKSCSLDPVPTFLLHEFIDLDGSDMSNYRHVSNLTRVAVVQTTADKRLDCCFGDVVVID